jgi:hypothetical protein
MSENSTDSEVQWTHIDALMKAGGQITLGRMAPLDGVAVAADDKDIYAVLRRRPEETVAALLQRLDQAIGSAGMLSGCPAPARDDNARWSRAPRYVHSQL